MFDFMNSWCVPAELIGIVGALGTVTAFFWLCSYRKLLRLVVIPHLCLFVPLIVWLIVSLSMPRVVDRQDYCEVKEVTFPDGRKVQMFAVDGENINANTMFQQIISEDMMVRRDTYKRSYFGICYNRQSLQTSYNLVKKDKK